MPLHPNSVITERCEWRGPDNHLQRVPELKRMKGFQNTLLY